MTHEEPRLFIIFSSNHEEQKTKLTKLTVLKKNTNDENERVR
jgi:hypothetical protein